MDTNRVLKKRPLTRRRVLRSLTATAIGGPLLISGMLSWPGRAAAATPSVGGTLRLAMGDASPNDKLDPTKQVTNFESVSIAMFYDMLVELDNNFVPQPMLADSWENSSDLKTWTIKLRKGVQFHDGTPFTSADAVFSIRRNIDPTGTSVVASILGPFLRADGVVAVDPTTVQLKLEAPYAFVPTALGNRFMRMVKDGTTDYSNPIGTGPFMYKAGSFNPGLSITAVRNPNYWKQGKPYLEAIEMSNISEPSSKIQALLSDNVDVIDTIEYALVPTVEQSSGHGLLLLENAFWTPIALAIDQKPFDDHRVIEAIRMSIDREQIVQTVFNGAASVAHDVPIPVGDPVFDTSLPTPKRDVDGARSLLREAGYPDGIDYELIGAPILGSIQNLAVAVSEQAAEAGIRFKVNQWPASTFWDEVFLKKPCYATYWSRRTAADVFSIALSSSGAWNETHFKDPEFDDLLAQAKATAEPAKQKEYYQKLQQITYARSSYIIPTFAHSVWAQSSRFSGVKLSIISFIDFSEAALS